MVQRTLYRVVVAILLSGCIESPSSCQAQTSDSSAHVEKQKPSLLLQFLGGSAAYAVPFWTVHGQEYIFSGEATDAGGVFLGIIASGLAVPFIGNLTCQCDGSYWTAIGGAFVGGLLIAGPLYGGALYYSNSTLLKYLALSVPPVVVATLLYNLTLDENAYSNSSSYQLFFYPSISKSLKGFGINVRF